MNLPFLIIGVVIAFTGLLFVNLDHGVMSILGCFMIALSCVPSMSMYYDEPEPTVRKTAI